MAQSFRLASYNILANSYVRPQWYAQVQQDVLAWGTRQHALAAHIARFDADIVCLQEVETDAYTLLAQALAAHGYTGIYAQKGQGRPDGCATFYRPAVLQLAGSEVLYYHDQYQRTAQSGHLALITSFASERGTMCVAGTHLRWDGEDKPTEAHVGYRQLRELLASRVAPDQTSYAWVICGDLNAQPGSHVIAALTDGGFIDAYANQAQPTSNPNQRAKRIDYIFHTAGLHATPAPLRPIDNSTQLPSSDEPSDHLAVIATLTMTS